MKKQKTAKGMTVRVKLWMYSLITLVIIILTAAIGLEVVSLTNRAHTSRYENYGKGELELSAAFSHFHEVKVHLRNMLYLYADDASKQADEITTIHNTVKEAEEDLTSFAARLDNYTDEIADNYAQCMVYIEEYTGSVEQAIAYVEAGDIESGRQELLTTGVTSANNAEGFMNIILAEMDEESANASTRIATQIDQLRMIIIIICIISVIISTLYCLRLIRAISVPVARMTVAAKKLAEGDVDVNCEKLHNDDLGALMDDFSEMAVAIREQVHIARQIAEGDMTVPVEPRSERDVLGNALKTLVDDNNFTLGNIREATSQVSTGASEVAAASQALAEGSTEQASAIEQVTASINEIAERTKGNAAEANEADSLVQSVKEKAVSGNDQMKSMIDAMHEINASSETISKIIKVIDDIAFQTNILALNAAVEAARAGEHGKGFAVVADEVRNLAAKSASAASETAEMIEDSISKVAHGTKLAEETAVALDEIVRSIDQIVALIDSIAASSQEQSTAVSQIDQAIDQVSQVVQTNSATSEQCAAASEELSHQAEKLNDLMAKYKLLTGTTHNGIE
ncbi:MAG: methyl-accepting chemotaxis protein [Roseburia sp.]